MITGEMAAIAEAAITAAATWLSTPAGASRRAGQSATCKAAALVSELDEP